MIVSVFRRRLRDGVTFEEFERVWEAERGFGVPARVFNAVRLDDEREVLTVGFVNVEVEDVGAALEHVAAQEAVRHDRIDGVIESTELRAMYRVVAEHDFTAEPREVSLGSEDSLLGPLT